MRSSGTTADCRRVSCCRAAEPLLAGKSSVDFVFIALHGLLFIASKVCQILLMHRSGLRGRRGLVHSIPLRRRRPAHVLWGTSNGSPRPRMNNRGLRIRGHTLGKRVSLRGKHPRHCMIPVGVNFLASHLVNACSPLSAYRSYSTKLPAHREDNNRLAA